MSARDKPADPSGTTTAQRSLRDLIAAAMLDASAIGAAAADAAAPGQTNLAEGVPVDSIPGYEIVREIHRGGQGRVFQAIQKATRRKVAIKVIRAGPLADPHERARFEREVGILSQLNHPNIVTIHDSNTLGDLSYHVMEYVPGQPLDAYMASGSLSIDETLRLFMKICEAMNAAHLRGVIHRDLKPGNIRIDPSGEPHILDFGLAKIGAADLSGEPQPRLMTVTGQFVGSLPWASPEQAEGMPEKIDIRTDVYSLGVVLYQMLTGRFPYQVVGTMRDVLDNILRVEPARPSSVRRQINDEVETIVLKCLDKQRERRYQSAGELARDVGHYLADEPIEAKRDSGWYFLRKTLRRYRAPVAVAAAFFLLVTASAIALAVMYERAQRQAARAERETRVAVATAEVLSSIIEAIDPIAPSGAMDLDLIAARARTEPIDDPEQLAKLHYALAVGYWYGCPYDPGKSYGRAAEEARIAAELQEPTLGRDHTDTLRSIAMRAGRLLALGQVQEAEQLAREVVERTRGASDDPHPWRAWASIGLANVLNYAQKHDEAEAWLRDALAVAQQAHGPNDIRTWSAIVHLTNHLCAQGRYEEAEALLRPWADQATSDVDGGRAAQRRAWGGLAAFYNDWSRIDGTKKEEARRYDELLATPDGPE